jgi:hypothetical protein
VKRGDEPLNWETVEPNDDGPVQRFNGSTNPCLSGFIRGDGQPAFFSVARTGSRATLS